MLHSLPRFHKFYSKMSTTLKNYPGTGLASCPVYDFSPTNHTKCMRCSFCTKHWIQTHTFTSAVTTCKFNVPIKDVSMNFSCHSKNVIYLITCTKCEVQYVGLTRQKIKERIAQHIRHIKNNSLSTYLVQHFNNNDHSISDLIVKIIDYLPETKDNVNELFDLENYWMRTLNSIYPFGLNNNVKGLGNISRTDLSQLNTSTSPYFTVPQKRRRRSHGHHSRNKELCNNQKLEPEFHLKQLFTTYHDNPISKLYISLRSLSYKHLVLIRNMVLTSPFVCDKKFNEIILAFSSKLIKPKKQVKAEKIAFIVPYLNKLMDEINLGGMLHSKKLRNTLPIKLKYTNSIVVSYKFSKTIGQSLFNYNKVLREFSNGCSNTLVCDCKQNPDLAPFIYKPHGHVHTGNLDIIEHPELRKIMQKGARFREIPNISHRNYIFQLCKSIDKFVIKWSKKEKVPISTFDDWSKLLKMFIKSKFKSKGFADTEYISILNTNNVKDYIYEMHKKFVISPIDKASNNFAIICKKFYLDVIQGELGISEKIKGNSVYKPVNQNIDNIIEKHVDSIKNDFNINIKEVDKNIPLLYWVSKQHKNPYKFRFIAGATNCTTKTLSVQLSLALKLIKNHFKNYCNKITKLNGYCMHWSIDNSFECMSKIKNVNAHSVYTFDFSTLYTNLPLIDIHDKLTKLIKKMYQNANAHYILVNTYTGKAFWSHTDKGSYKSFNLQHLLDALEFILNNTYIKFGQQLFLQTKGIPMGGNASPLIADLYLSWLEYQYLSKLVRNKDFNLLHKLKYNSRYIDDIITPNVENFLEIAKHIYPIEIPLEQTNNDSLHDTFLDLDITVVNKRFCFKVFHKVDLFDFEVISFPFLESNIPQYICYNTFFSQLVRFSTICSNTSGFAERVHIIYQKLLKRNYDKKKLEKTFNKFTCHYSENLIKYDIPIQKLWQVCLNYNSVTPPSIINKVSFADSNSIFQTNN